MRDDVKWVSMAVRQPADHEVVYARPTQGTPKKVMFYASPERWVGSSIVYDAKYFVEWAPLGDAVPARLR